MSRERQNNSCTKSQKEDSVLSNTLKYISFAPVQSLIILIAAETTNKTLFSGGTVSLYVQYSFHC